MRRVHMLRAPLTRFRTCMLLRRRRAQEPETARVWQRKFGFTPIAPRELKRLQAAVPPLAFYTDALLLSKPLPPRDRRQQQEQQPMAASGGAAAAAAAVDS